MAEATLQRMVEIRTVCTDGHDETRTVERDVYDSTMAGQVPHCPVCGALTTTRVKPVASHG